MKYLILISAFQLLFMSVFSSDNPTAKELIQMIKNNVNCQWSNETVDTFKSGNPNDKVTGVISCMFANMRVLEEAVEKNCNLIIAHEPVFYNHLDETTQFKNDPVFAAKMAFIKKHKLIIWRFHDHWHRHQPDGIYQGVLEKLAWSDQCVDGRMDLIKVKSQSLSEMASFLKKTFNADAIRVIGNPNLEIKNVLLSVGAPGSTRHFASFNNDNFELMIAGESPEWETYQYVNDAVMQGKEKAIIFLGHIPSEEAGMDYFSKWLTKLNPGVPVYFVENGVPYWSPN